jgi:hypothetical protein
MRKHSFFWVVVAILALQVMALTSAQADVVGRLTQVEGRVDILRGGKLPATPVKISDEVQPGDVLRTKSLSKAQITFIDNSTMAIAPESRVGIEAYMYNAAQKKRNAVVELFQGLAHIVVSKLFESSEPEFVVKTQTAIVGVRGTDFGIRIHPNSADVLNFSGRLQVGSIFPEVGQLDRRAFKVAYDFGPGGGGGSHWVTLRDMQGTSVARGLPPTQPYGLTDQDRDMFMRQVAAVNPSGCKFSQDQGTVCGPSTGPSTGPLTSISPVSANAPGEQSTLTLLNSITVPPTVVPQQVAEIQPQTITGAAGIAIPVFNILISWGAGGTDLDLHLTGPQPGGTFEVYYANRGSLTTQPFALLQSDDTGTSGSEVITVQQFNQGGLYQAFVFNYGNQDPNSTNLSTTAGLSMQVINGGTVVDTANGGSTVTGGTLVITLTPTPGQAGNTWQAITIDPATGEVIVVNQITDPPAEAKAATETTTVAVTSLTTVAAAPSAATTTAEAAAATGTGISPQATPLAGSATPARTRIFTRPVTLASATIPTGPISLTGTVAPTGLTATTLTATTPRLRTFPRARIPSRTATLTGTGFSARPLALTAAQLPAAPLALAAASPGGAAITPVGPRSHRRARIHARHPAPAAAPTATGGATPAGVPR